jgi:HlyD family secretion protein
VKVRACIALALIAACRSSSSTERTATGTLQYVEIDVAPVAPGRVVLVNRREGEAVHAGDTLAVLTDARLAPNVEAMRARLRTADARLRQLLAGPRASDVERAEAELRAAQSEVDRTASDVERLAPLGNRGDISRQQLDAAQAGARTAAAKRDVAQHSLTTLRAGARPEEIDAARSELANAQAAVRGATATESDMVLTSPIDGTVVTRAMEPGEVAVAGAPVITVADVSRPYVKVYVDQLTLPLLHVGDSATARLDAFPDRSFIGRIAAIGTKAEFTPRVALTKDERADLMFAVRVEFSDPSGTLKAGLPITVRFGGR